MEAGSSCRSGSGGRSGRRAVRRSSGSSSRRAARSRSAAATSGAGTGRSTCSRASASGARTTRPSLRRWRRAARWGSTSTACSPPIASRGRLAAAGTCRCPDSSSRRSAPGFDLFSRGVTAQLTRSAGVATGTSVGYRLGNNDTSNRELNREDEDIVDRLFPNVRLSSFTAIQVRDTRDDPVDPARGSFVTLESEVAARTIGSEVGFSKSFLSASVYRRVPRVPRIVVAAGARLGRGVGVSAGSRCRWHARGATGVDAIARAADQRAVLRGRQHHGPRVRPGPARKPPHGARGHDRPGRLPAGAATPWSFSTASCGFA